VSWVTIGDGAISGNKNKVPSGVRNRDEDGAPIDSHGHSLDWQGISKYPIKL
jgi:hypothetical protein